MNSKLNQFKTWHGGEEHLAPKIYVYRGLLSESTYIRAHMYVIRSLHLHISLTAPATIKK